MSAETQQIDGGNFYDKYASRNPIERYLMNGFTSSLESLVIVSGASEVHEVGCGEGELTRRFSALGLQARGSDLSDTVIKEAKNRSSNTGDTSEFKAASIYDLTSPDDSAELVVCCEVLEHLEEPELALSVLTKIAKSKLIVSVPREPIWRGMNMARGAYLRDFGNTPGHLNHWSKKGFVSFLNEQVDVLEVASPLPWTMALCEPRD